MYNYNFLLQLFLFSCFVCAEEPSKISVYIPKDHTIIFSEVSIEGKTYQDVIVSYFTLPSAFKPLKAADLMLLQTELSKESINEMQAPLVPVKGKLVLHYKDKNHFELISLYDLNLVSVVELQSSNKRPVIFQEVNDPKLGRKLIHSVQLWNKLAGYLKKES